MSPAKHIVLDANIMVRGVLGVRVRGLMRDYQSRVTFYVPDVCLDDARKYVPLIAEKRKLSSVAGLETLDQLVELTEVVPHESYEVFETTARRRIASRDVDDWPILATSLFLNCPIWTEDRDFFGCGVATWTTDNVQLYFRND